MSCERSSNQGELSHDSQQIREVYARFGLAMYQGQCVEKQVGIILATTFEPNFFHKTPEERGVIFDKKFKKTLGKMIKELRNNEIELDPKFEKRLQFALEQRNWLAHNYFWERALFLLNPDGRERMINELQNIADTLELVDKELTSVTDRWLVKAGISKETVIKHFLKNVQVYDDQLDQ